MIKTLNLMIRLKINLKNIRIYICISIQKPISGIGRNNIIRNNDKLRVSYII